MAKVKINTEGLTKALKETFNSVVKNKQTQEEIAEFIVNRIVSLARTGKTQVGGDRKSLPKLSTSYRDYRKTAGAQKKAGQFFRPTSAVSNLTFTGQLLENLSFKIKQDKILIYFENTSRSDSKATNAKIYEYLLEKDIGYDILGLDNAGKERVRRIVIDLLRKEIKSRFK